MSVKPTPTDKAWTGTSNILLGAVTGNGPAIVAELTLLGEQLAGEELDNFNTAITTFESELQTNGGDWNAAFQTAFGSGSVFQNTAKSDLLAAAISAVGQIAGFIQGWVGMLKGLL